MSSYERVLQKSRERLQPDAFLPATEMGKYSLRSMVQFAEYLGAKPKLISRSLEDEQRDKLYKKILKKQGITGANKASIVFAELDNQQEITALPVVEEKDYSPFAWHDNSINHYKGMVQQAGGQFWIAGYPEYFEGEALLVEGYEKPILQTVARCKVEDLEQRLPLIEKLSVDFPEAMFCVRSNWLRKFIMIDEGNRQEKSLRY